MKVPMIDLRAQFEEVEGALREAVDRVLESQCYILGPEVEALESAIASLCGVRHAIGVSNGTDALLLALMGLEIGPGDEVIVPAFTFFATAGAVARVGATPVFVDILPDMFDLDAKAVAAALTERTRAIIPVHLYGQCAEMDRLRAVAEPGGIPMIEDAAQAIGATYRGRPACSLGRVATLSFYPTKNLSAIGEAGMVLTGDDELASRLRSLRNHGQGERYAHHHVGGNFRLDAIQAAALRVKLTRLKAWNDRRRRAAARYDEGLRGTGVVTPAVRPECEHVYHQYTIRSRYRDALRACLADAGVATGVYYPIPLHLQPCFRHLGYQRGDLPVSEEAAERVLSLPIFASMTPDQQDHVIETIRRFMIDASDAA